MLNKDHYKVHLPKELYDKIEEICEGFKEIHKETDGMLANSNMPDSSAQLSDVLKSTEDATNTILDAATSIQTEMSKDGMPAASVKMVNDHITRIFEACTFQDITGQRIKKVLKTLDQVEQKLYKLVEIAKTYSGDTAVPQAAQSGKKETLMNGPALTGSATSQADIDRLLSGG